MLIVSSWSERFRFDIGLHGVSQIWEGPPAWYLWLDDAPGVYELVLLNAECVSINKTSLPKALFGIKCYPYQRTRHFDVFSSLEKKLIGSRFFDTTNAPVFELREQIPPDLFNVAMLEMVMDPNTHHVAFRLEALDVLRNRYAQAATQSFPELDYTRQFALGEIDRNLPGLRIAFPLFDRLICLFAHATKQPPYHIQCAQMPGFEIVINNANVDANPVSDIKRYRMDVCHGAPKGGCPIKPMAIGDEVDGQHATIIYDRIFPNGHGHDEGVRDGLPITINKKWWLIPHEHYTSELASSCGCCG